jgi:hypothetical protein
MRNLLGANILRYEQVFFHPVFGELMRKPQSVFGTGRDNVLPNHKTGNSSSGFRHFDLHFCGSVQVDVCCYSS